MKQRTLNICVLTAVGLLWSPLSVRIASAQSGIALFEQHCASCHAAPAAASRAPNQDSLMQMAPETILDALTNGSMVANASALSTDQKRALAEYLAGRPLGAAKTGEASAMKNRCPTTPFADPLKGPAWNGWGVDVANTRYQPAAAAGLAAGQVPRLKLKWAFGFPNGRSAYGQPTVAGGRVYVGADTGFVYSLDAASACVYWSFAAQAGVRTAVSIGPANGSGQARHAVYFGDLKGNVYAVDAETGALLWTKRTDSHRLARITGAPTLAAGRLYVPVTSLEEVAGPIPDYECCTFRGSVVAYDATTGEQLWKSYTIEGTKPTRKTSLGTQLWGPAGAGVWSAPTIDLRRRALYVATGDAYTAPAADESDAVMAFDLDTGKRLWVKQLLENDAWLLNCEPDRPNRSETCPEKSGPDYDFGQSPILRTLPNGRSILAIGQKSGVAWGLDPDKQGAVVWQHRVGKGSFVGGMEWGSAADERLAYFANADGPHGPADAGGLAALGLATGERVWFTRPPPLKCAEERGCVQAQSAAITAIPGVVFSGTTNGIMRAYSTEDGRVIWEYNTAQDFTTVNGVPAKGGAINGPGPTVVAGTLFVTSGYGGLGGSGPGNVLLAFAVD